MLNVRTATAAEISRYYSAMKIDFDEGWVHLRKSNTEPIIRIYSEGKTEAEAERFADMILDEAKKMV